MTVHVNENCIGCSLCPSICPKVFTMTDEGVAAARDEISPEDEGLAQEAAESCPVSAIEIS
ncbi:MAG: ferredoxin [Lawsonibacter sp.]|nr:ferredoxin [Lawsonibacter sp.]